MFCLAGSLKKPLGATLQSASNTAWEFAAMFPASTALNAGMETFDPSLYADAAEVESFFAGEIDSTRQDSPRQ